MTTADLCDSIMEKRIELLQLRLKLKLYSVLNNQVMTLFSPNCSDADKELECFDFKRRRCMYPHLIFHSYNAVQYQLLFFKKVKMG